MSELRAVIDTNIAVSGLLFGGLPSKIVRAALKGRFAWISSEPLLGEVNRVMGSKKFALSATELEDLLNPVLAVLEIVTPRRKIALIARCPADNRVLEAAHEGNAHAIVTGDRRDLLSLNHFERIPILTARAFLDLL